MTALAVDDDIVFTSSVTIERSTDPVAVFDEVLDGHRPLDPGCSASVFDVRNAATDFDSWCLGDVGNKLLILFSHAKTPRQSQAPAFRITGLPSFPEHERNQVSSPFWNDLA